MAEKVEGFQWQWEAGEMYEIEGLNQRQMLAQKVE